MSVLRDRLVRLGVVLAVALVATACATAPAPPGGAQRMQDDALAADVEAALRGDPYLYARHIDVASDRGVVRLSGFVYEPEDFYAARRIASAVPGVRSVVVELELLRGGMRR